MKKLKFLIALIVLFSCLTLGVCAVEQPSEINVGYVAKYGTVTSAFYEDTKGYGYEYLNGLLAYMDGDYTLNFVSCTSWQDGLDKLDSGEIDIIGPMFETAAGDVCYTSENFGECTLILASVDNAQGLIDDLSALDGSTIGVPDYYPDYSVLTNFLQEQGIDADIMVLPSLELNITLGMNEVDYVFMSSLQTQLGLTVVTYIDAQPVYFVGAPESQALLDEIDQALIALKAAEPVFESQLALKYSSYNYTANAYISEENYALLQEKGTYTVGVRNFNSPLLQENGNGELEGVAFVMLDMLSEAGNISFEYVELDDSATIEDCQNIDFLVAATDDTLALGFPYESGSYLSLPCLLLDRTNKETIETIGVASDYRISNLLEDGKLYGREVVQYATVSELQEAFDADEVDSILFTVISFNMIRDQFQNQDFIASTVDDDLEFVMAFSEDLTAEELTVFNKLIANLDQSVLDAALIEYAVTPQATSLLTMIKDNPWVVFNLVVGIMVLIVISAIVSERKRRLLLSKIIDYDELTGLSSKRKLMQDAQVLMEKNPTIQYDFLSMDIDNFKHINEMYGYQTGSELLKIIARNIGQRLTPTTLFARATGDHFLMFFERDGQGSTEQWLAFEKELQHSIYTQLDIVAHTTFSMGIYEVKDPSMDINIMIDYANIARTHGKGTIGFTCYYFTAEMAEASTISNRITTEMVPAIQNEEFVLYYQPKFELKTERTIGAEVLVRWIKDGTVIPPIDSFRCLRKMALSKR
ncbi:diguanylate cyclase [Bengtsoniella intestinalis]|uniref:diguanylate cyclase domain-containing protein n=1 Tax=Bengtsoniella intestinalis TaxID=3073143 RepID=UPI00391F4BFB